MSGGVNGACSPCTNTAQNATARVQSDQSKSLDIMKKMASGELSGSEGMKQLQALVVDQAVAMGTLPASMADKFGGAAPPSAPPSVGFSSHDTFDSGGARPAPLLDLKGGGMPQDTSFLAKDSGGGAKPGIASGTN